jgi:hypothetical protein
MKMYDNNFKCILIKSLLVTSILLISIIGATIHAQQFAAEGPTTETKLEPEELLGAVTITFDLLPTTMSFDLPWNYCAVSENGIKFSSFAAETYDPRDWKLTGGGASFEAGMDRKGKYARVWIAQESAARIVVRARYALNNLEYDIAHADIPSGSPYGEGDWGDEWFYIYPDGTYLRHMKIYTGLASMSLPFGFNREPPKVVHEFTENVVIGPAGHDPEDDIENEAVTLYKMYGKHTGIVHSDGIGKTFSFEPDYPTDYGEFRDANIMLINSKSSYRPFTIGMPYGVRIQPYQREDNGESTFQTWRIKEPSIGYITPVGHMINYWHYRRTDNTLEQVYLHGMTNEEDPQSELVKIGWSWIVPPELQIDGHERDYFKFTYDQTQKAYIVPRNNSGSEKIDFVLDAIYDEDYLYGTMWLVNPAFIIKDWGTDDIALEIDNVELNREKDYRVGYEKTAEGTDLVIWIHRTIDLNTEPGHDINVSIIPKRISK